MEQRILSQVEESIAKAIQEGLVGYNKPLSILTAQVIESNHDVLFNLINDEFSTLLNGKGFKKSLKDALNKKLANTLINRMGGDLEKRVNELQQNPQTRAKVTLAISSVIEDL